MTTIQTLQSKIIIATKDHSMDLALIHVKAWRETYEGQIPISFLTNLDPNQKSTMWSKIISEKSILENIYLIQVENTFRGFVNFGPGRGAELKECGEIYSLYLLKEC